MLLSKVMVDWQSGTILDADEKFRDWIGGVNPVDSALSEYLQPETGPSLKDQIITAVSNGNNEQLYLRPLFENEKFTTITTFVNVNENLHQNKMMLQLFPVCVDPNLVSDEAIPSEIFDSINDFIFVCRPDYTIAKANASAKIVYGGGYDLEGSKCYEVVFNKNGSHEICPLAETLMSGKVVPFEYFDHDLGEYMEARTYPLTDNHDQYRGFTLINRIVTARRKEEIDTIRQEKLDILSRFSSGIFHDFNNRLTIILGRVQLLRQKIHDPGVIASLKTIEKTAMESTEMIQHLQDITRLPEKLEMADLPQVDLNELINDVLPKIRTIVEERFEDQGIHVEIETDLNEVSPVNGDKKSLSGALYNLVVNAIEALDKGGVVTLWTDKDENTIQLGVSDTGQGISEDIIDKIYDPFFSTKNEKDSGLGLSEVYSVISQHNVSIDVQSTAEEGTTFVVSFPIISEV